MMNVQQRILALQERLEQEKVDAYLVPTHDEFQGEYTPACAQRLAWLSGFTGSAGSMLICGSQFNYHVLLFVDGRYTVQGAQQCGAFAEIKNVTDITPLPWLLNASNVGQPVRFGYDPSLFTTQQIERWQQMIEVRLSQEVIELVPLSENLVDALWEDRPDWPCQPVVSHLLEHAGCSHQKKVTDITHWLGEKGADGVFLSRTDSIAWLLNIRGSDVPYNPLVLAYALVTVDGEVSLYLYDVAQAGEEVRAHLGDAVTVAPMSAIEDINVSSICYESASLSEALYHRLSRHAEMIAAEDPCTLPKAIKNDVEIKGTRAAHKRDGKALTAFLSWLDECFENHRSIDELGAESKLQSLRAEQLLYQGDSFATIAGAGPHGAIVHYRAVEETNRTLGKGELLLVDSGGQYLDGTTDVTRTVVYGEPSAEQIDRYTRVLKGHIAIAQARFPKGVTGSQLDALARGPLWEVGLDYAHGTGHGVGSYLCVHEGPQGISSRASNVPLEAGMILSNEPGYYKEGEYGIRIENLVLVVSLGEMEDGREWLGFETLTKAPMCEKLIHRGMLTSDEAAWLDGYQSQF